MEKLRDHLYRFLDTCNVYLIRIGRSAVLIDFGSGDVLDHLAEIGVDTVAAVLMTHHHRDQGQGLARAAAANIPIWVPHTEQDFFADADALWQAREIYVNYNMRQDRFSLLESVPVAGTLRDYSTHDFGGLTFSVIPTPGHTTGSITLLLEQDSGRLAFTGDLIAAPGKIWSMSATQWTYNGAEGGAAGVASLLDLRDRQPDLLLPSHGEPMPDPLPAIDAVVNRFLQLLQLRGHNLRLTEFRDQPYEPITPHLLRHRTSVSNCYVLLSASGRAMFIDFGYDFVTGFALGVDRASRRPWLYTIPALKQQYNVRSIDVVLPTHFHDDHVAGINLLRDVEGAQLWAADLFADILEHPATYDLPCIWYDPIPVDRRLPLETPFQWEEYTFTLHHLPGHTLYAVAISFEVDGRRVLASGDQYAGEAGLEPNYVYPNRFRASDYVETAALYRRLNPELIITGHWQPFWVPPDYFGKIEQLGAEIERLHRELLPQQPDLTTEGFIARITPYQAAVHLDDSCSLTVDVLNPFDHPAEAVLQFVAPPGWRVSPPVTLSLDRSASCSFTVTPPSGFAGRRARVAVDVTVGGQRFGQQAEALVSSADR